MVHVNYRFAPSRSGRRGRGPRPRAVRGLRRRRSSTSRRARGPASTRPLAQQFLAAVGGEAEAQVRLDGRRALLRPRRPRRQLRPRRPAARPTPTTSASRSQQITRLRARAAGVADGLIDAAVAPPRPRARVDVPATAAVRRSCCATASRRGGRGCSWSSCCRASSARSLLLGFARRCRAPTPGRSRSPDYAQLRHDLGRPLVLHHRRRRVPDATCRSPPTGTSARTRGRSCPPTRSSSGG